MTMSPSKEALLARLNDRAEQEHLEAVDSAHKRGRPAPPKPVPLTAADIDFPKWMHRGWKPTDKGNGHQVPKESRLVRSPEELAALDDGWSEEPPKPAPKK